MMNLAQHTDELVRGPLVGAGIKDTVGSDLGEAQALLVSLAAVARALGEVVDHGTVVRLGPGVPLKDHIAACGDSDGGLTRSSFLEQGQVCHIVLFGS